MERVMTVLSGIGRHVARVALASSLAIATLPAAAQVYTLAEERRMAELRVTPAEVAEIRTAVPRVASFLNDVWSTTAQRNGLPYATPRIAAYTETFEHPICGRVPVNNAAYCPRGNVVLYDPIFLTALAKIVGRGAAAEGWFAIVVVIAHEWGHSIVLQTQGATMRSRRMHEFAADCLAGAVTRVAFNNRAITQRDVNSAYRTMSVLGDDVTPAQNRANMRGGHGHGSGNERQTAFAYGYDHGGARCMTATAGR
jgi:predicted metalloprotease